MNDQEIVIKNEWSRTVNDQELWSRIVNDQELWSRIVNDQELCFEFDEFFVTLV